MADCIFCKIISGEIPSSKVYDDETVMAFNDVSPEAPVHVLIVPKAHISSANDITEENAQVVSKIFLAAKKIAEDMNIAEDGYRIVNNCGENGGQSVKHLHFHLIGGRSLNWPPG